MNTLHSLHARIAPAVAAFVIFASAQPAVRPEPFIDTTGSGALVRGDYQTALDSLGRRKPGDTLFFLFKQAVAYYQLKNLDKALPLFQQCTAPSFALRGITLEYIGDIEIQRGRYADAAQTYLSAQRDSLPEKMKKKLVEKLNSLINADPFIVAAFPELAGLAAEQQVSAVHATVVDTVGPLLDSLLLKKNWAEADSMLSLYLDTTASDRTCGCVGRVRGRELTDSALATRRLFMLAYGAYACKWYAAADSFLSRAEARKDFFRTVRVKEHLFLRGFINYSRAKYAAATMDLSEYQKRYGPTPEIILALGRSFSFLSRDTLAVFWYNRFISLYPGNSNTPEIYWHLARKYEEEDRFDRAVGLYQKIASMRKSGGRADDAFFRKGLCDYKSGHFLRACSTLTSFSRLFEDSPLLSAALYWKGKCVLALGRSADAAKLFSSVVCFYPTDYYSYRAREMLALMGDTAKVLPPDTLFDIAATRQWIDSMSNAQKQPLSSFDSLLYRRGTLLVFAGQSSHASMFLEGLELRYPANLAMQFDLALLYKFINDPVFSFRLARRLAWRIPVAARFTMPQPLYDLLYPFPFPDIVLKEAGRNAIDPFLVTAVIRQESIFDPVLRPAPAQSASCR